MKLTSMLHDNLTQMILHAQIFVYSFLLLALSPVRPADSTTIHEVNEAVFLDPRTHSALIRCPLDFTHSSDIQWYDVANRRYETDRGRYYRINGTQPFDREFICSTASQAGADSNEKYRIKIRTYGKPCASAEHRIEVSDDELGLFSASTSEIIDCQHDKYCM